MRVGSFVILIFYLYYIYTNALILKNMVGKTEDENDFSEIAGKIAVSASGIALFSGIIALSAFALSDQKTRNKITRESRSIFENFRQLINYLKTSSKQLQD
jgi:hypothetical protein